MSVAATLTLMNVVEIFAPSVGEVIDTVGAIVSGGSGEKTTYEAEAETLCRALTVSSVDTENGYVAFTAPSGLVTITLAAAELPGASTMELGVIVLVKPEASAEVRLKVLCEQAEESLLVTTSV